MEELIQITGKVTYSITLDPGVWIFDERTSELETFLSTTQEELDPLAAYKKSIGAQWDKEIHEGAQVNIQKETLKKEKWTKGTFAIPLLPFIQNAKPLADAEKILLLRDNDLITLSLSEIEYLIVAFARDGKKLQDGPLHVYHIHGTQVYTHVKGFLID